MEWTEEGMASKTLKNGETVSWKSSQGTVTGKVVKKQTRPTKIKGHKVTASKSEPQFIVESDKTGQRAAHKAGALRRKS